MSSKVGTKIGRTGKLSQDKYDHLTHPIPLRFTKRYWAKVTTLADMYQVTAATMFRMKAEDWTESEINDEIKRKKEQIKVKRGSR